MLFKNVPAFNDRMVRYTWKQAPEQQKVIDQTKIVFDYLANNAAALKYYQGQHLFTTMDELTNGQIREIYEHLKKNKKL